jgi:KUP system potassium uptake protein
MLGSIVMLFMLFWTWAKRLEDRFDGAKRRNLRHFIVAGGNAEVTIPTDGAPHSISGADELDNSESIEQQHYYFASDKIADEEEDDDRREIVRIPTCAVFHKFAAGKGVPHSFIGFIRQWPALPQIVIFLSVCILPVPRVPVDERYDVDKVRSVKGFYGVTYYIGFREDFEVKIEELIAKICLLESPDDGKPSETIARIRKITRRTTHMVPHYHVMSKVELREGGVIRVPFNWIRKFLIESIYRRLIISFPETAKWTNPADEIIRVGVTAKI